MWLLNLVFKFDRFKWSYNDLWEYEIMGFDYAMFVFDYEYFIIIIFLDLGFDFVMHLLNLLHRIYF